MLFESQYQMRGFHNIKATATALAIALSSSACTESGQSHDSDADILFSVGDATLSRADVERLIPAGLSGEDSVRMFDAIAESNLKSMLLQEIAFRNLTHPERIKNAVNEYRNRLVIMEYQKNMADSGTPLVSEQEMLRYYRTHTRDFILTYPLVKGLYLKTVARGSDLDNVRILMEKGSQEAVDMIEKTGLRDAEEYDYFIDRWVAWPTISDVIPHDFGDPDEFLRAAVAGHVTETRSSNSTYLLKVTAVMPSGRVMPYDYARDMIGEILARENREAFEDRLVEQLYHRAIKDGKFQSGVYDIDRRIFKKKHTDDNNKTAHK